VRLQSLPSARTATLTHGWIFFFSSLVIQITITLTEQNKDHTFGCTDCLQAILYFGKSKHGALEQMLKSVIIVIIFWCKIILWSGISKITKFFIHFGNIHGNNLIIYIFIKKIISSKKFFYGMYWTFFYGAINCVTDED
jgi:hypothetical protein